MLFISKMPPQALLHQFFYNRLRFNDVESHFCSSDSNVLFCIYFPFLSFSLMTLLFANTHTLCSILKNATFYLLILVFENIKYKNIIVKCVKTKTKTYIIRTKLIQSLLHLVSYKPWPRYMKHESIHIHWEIQIILIFFHINNFMFLAFPISMSTCLTCKSMKLKGMRHNVSMSVLRTLDWLSILETIFITLVVSPFSFLSTSISQPLFHFLIVSISLDHTLTFT